MKSSKHNNPESWRRDDVNLRRALQQRNSNLPLLPEDFADRVMAQLEEDPSPALPVREGAVTNSSRHSFIRIAIAALSTAALLALVFLLNSREEASRIAEAESNEPVAIEETIIEPLDSDNATEAATPPSSPALAQALNPSETQAHNPSDAVATSGFPANTHTPADATVTSTTPSPSATDDTLDLSPVDLDHLDHLVANASKDTYMIKEERGARENTTPQQASRLALALNLSMSGSDRSSSDISYLSSPSDKAARYFLPAGNGYTYDLNNQEAVRKSMILEYRSSHSSVEEKYYSMPITLGINIRWNMTQRWALESGLNYTYLYSSSKDEYDHTRQQIHYLGIPLRGLWQFFQRRHWSIYVSAGGSIEFPVSATNTTSHVAIDHPMATETSTLSAPIQFSTDIGLGVQYSLSRHLGFFAEPRLQWHIPTGSNIETYYTRHPLHFNPSLGLRLTL